jgi:hypothetical protein
VSALALQALLAATGRIGAHRLLGGIALLLVLAHIGGLALVSLEDTLFAMSPDGPTRARISVGHAVLTDGAMDGAGTTVLLLLGAAGLGGVLVAYAARSRTAGRR